MIGSIQVICNSIIPLSKLAMHNVSVSTSRAFRSAVCTYCHQRFLLRAKETLNDHIQQSHPNEWAKMRSRNPPNSAPFEPEPSPPSTSFPQVLDDPFQLPRICPADLVEVMPNLYAHRVPYNTIGTFSTAFVARSFVAGSMYPIADLAVRRADQCRLQSEMRQLFRANFPNIHQPFLMFLVDCLAVNGDGSLVLDAHRLLGSAHTPLQTQTHFHYEQYDEASQLEPDSYFTDGARYYQFRR